MKYYLFILIAVLLGTQTAFAESWTQINGSAPPAISGHTLVRIDNKLYLFGGKEATVETQSRTTNTRGNTSNKLSKGYTGHGVVVGVIDCGIDWNVEPSTGCSIDWNVEPSTSNQPPARYFHTAVALDGKMYVHGGVTENGNKSDMWEYDPQTNQWTKLQPPTVPYPKIHQGAVAAEGQIYVIGGLERNEYYESAYGSTWAFNPNDETWTKKANLSSIRYGHVTFYNGSKIYVTVGQQGDELLNDMWIYDIVNDKWSEIKTIGKPTAVVHPAYASNNEVLVISGGLKSKNGQLVDSAETWEYNIQENQWTQKNDGRAFPLGSGAMVRSRMVSSSTRSSSSYQALFFGGLRNNAEINETWLYDSSTTSSCSTTDNDLNVNIACVNYNASQYQVNLSLVTHPENLQTLLWKLDSVTNIIHSDSDNCASLDSELTIQFNCVLVGNTPYQAEFNAYTHPTDPTGFYWTLGNVAEK